MSFKRFREQDLIYTTLKAHPEYNFIVNNKITYLQKERTAKGNLSSESLRHVPTGSVSLYELNIDRSQNNLISLEVPLRDESGHKLRPFSMTREDRLSRQDTDTVVITYPLSASLNRIYVGQDTNFQSLYARTATTVEGGRSGVDPSQTNSLKHRKVDPPSANRKYVTALENLLSHPDDLQQGNFENYKLGAVNMVCIPGVFSGSGIKKGSIKLDYYITGSLVASAQDKFSNGKMICTEGPAAVKDTQIGTVLYNQGLILLTSSSDLHSTYTDYYYDTTTQVKPSWLNFGSGLSETGDSGLNLSSLTDKSSYVVNFKGTNKIPTLTMFAFSERGEHNFSNNPTFLENKRQGTTESLLGEYALSANSFTEKEANINKINKSEYQDASDSFKSTTYISKVGIYDEDKNLIAVATLANPIKKTEKRDFMIKMKIDF